MRLSATALVRMLGVAALCLLLTPVLFAQSRDAVPETFDPQTGEPIPFGFEAAPSDPAPRGGDELVPTQYLASGATKLIRALDTGSGAGSFVYQDGAYLISTAQFLIPEKEYPLDTLLLPAQPSDMVVQDGLGYIPLRKSKGLLILDVSSEENLQVVGQIEGRELLSIAVAGDYAYAGRGSAGIAVYDVSDPANPTEVGTVPSAGSSNGTWVDGTTLYVAAGSSGLRTFDLTDPAAPTALGSFATDAFCTYVAVRDGVAFLTGGFGLIALDVSDPAMPTQIGTFEADGMTTYEIALDGDAAYLSGFDGIRQLDITDLTAITQEAIVTGSQFLTVDFNAEGGSVLTAERFGGAYALDPDGLSEQLFLENSGFTNKLAFKGDLLFATDLAGRFRVIDTGGETAAEIGRIETPPNAQGLDVVGDYAYVTYQNGGGTGFTVIDISDPADPEIVGTYSKGNQAFGVDVVDDIAYVAYGFSGIVALDVSDPTDPTLLGSFFVAANAFDVEVEDEVAYLATTGGLFTLDVSDPANISQLDTETLGYLTAIDLDENEDLGLGSFPYAYVADGFEGFKVVDISDPADVVLVDSAPGQARDVAATFYFELDILFPRVYVADDFFGLREYRILEQEAVEVASFESTDRGIGVAATPPKSLEDGGTVALAAGETGIYLFAFQQFVVANEDGTSAEAFALESAYPNPSVTTATLRYTLPDAADATLAVYDVLGRRVAVLAEGVLAAGSHTATFDAAGLPSGVYVARLTVGARSLTQKLLVVR